MTQKVLTIGSYHQKLLFVWRRCTNIHQKSLDLNILQDVDATFTQLNTTQILLVLLITAM